jgi:hypothetical protein
MSISEHHLHPVRTATFLLLTSALAALPLRAQDALGGYTPLSARYRVTGSTHTSQVLMGQSQESDATSDQVTSIALAKSGGQLSLKMTLDSAVATASAPLPAPDMSGAIGLTLTAAMDLDGHVANHTVTDKTGKPSDSPLASSMRSFFPRLKVGATKGMTWTDTTTTHRNQNGADVATTVILTYTLAGDTATAKGKAWKILSTSTGTINGTGSQQGADFTIKGTMTGEGSVVVGANGVLELLEQNSSVNMVADVPMAGMQIPIVQKQSTKIVRLP